MWKMLLSYPKLRGERAGLFFHIHSHHSLVNWRAVNFPAFRHLHGAEAGPCAREALRWAERLMPASLASRPWNGKALKEQCVRCEQHLSIHCRGSLPLLSSAFSLYKVRSSSEAEIWEEKNVTLGRGVLSEMAWARVLQLLISLWF